MREKLLSTTAMVPMPVQQWQADAGGGKGGMVQDGGTPPADAAPDDAQSMTFEDIFEQLTTEEPAAEVEPQAKELAQEPQAKEPAQADEGLPTPEEVAAAEARQEPQAKEPTKVAEPAKETPPPTDEFFKRFGDFLDQRTPKETPAAQQDRQPQGPQYSADEKTFLESYEKEFPEVSRAEELKRREEYKALINYIGVQFGQVLAPLMQRSDVTGHQLHYQALTSLIPDYNDVRAPVITWAAAQPPVMRAAFEKVIQEGSPEDIAQLVNHWRVANNKEVLAPKDDAAKAAETAAKAAQDAAAAAKVAKRPTQQQIDALKPPVGRRTNVPQGEVSKEDFAGAFETFANLDA